MNLGVLDYGAGNLRSVLNAFTAIGRDATLVTKPAQFDDIDLLVFPGQGAFGDSVRILKRAKAQPRADLRVERVAAEARRRRLGLDQRSGDVDFRTVQPAGRQLLHNHVSARFSKIGRK